METPNHSNRMSSQAPGASRISPYPDYKTTEQTRVCMGAAWDTRTNPRNLKHYYGAAYMNTYLDLLEPWDNTPEFMIGAPSYIPVPLAKQEKRPIKDAGLSFDERPERPARLHKSKGMDPQEPYRSTRVSKQKQVVGNIQALEGEQSNLRAEKAGFAKPESGAQDVVDSDKGSVKTAATSPAKDATELKSDIVIFHLKYEDLDPQEYHGRRYEHLGTKKIAHQCYALITEVNPLPGRNKDNHDDAKQKMFLEAQKKLYAFCIVNFENNPDAYSVAAVATAGPYWIWAHIKRADVPSWDDYSNELVPDGCSLADFCAQFPDHKSAPCLGTEKSDHEFIKLRQQVLVPLFEGRHE